MEGDWQIRDGEVGIANVDQMQCTLRLLLLYGDRMIELGGLKAAPYATTYLKRQTTIECIFTSILLLLGFSLCSRYTPQRCSLCGKITCTLQSIRLILPLLNHTPILSPST